MMAQQLETELFRQRFDDGALDLLAGIAITGIGLSWIFDHAAYGAILPAVIWPFWLVIHRRIVVPRLGDVEFSAGRKTRLADTHRMLFILGLASFVGGLAAFFYFDRTEGAYESLVVPLILLVPSLVMAIAALVAYGLIGGRRMLVYAGVFVATGVVCQFLLDLDPGHSLAAGGLLPVMTGAVMLVRFLRSNPRQA